MDSKATTPDVETCDLCIVGAGHCGLNFLFSAVQYLGKDSKVILVDQKPTLGGMWNDTYDYVALHQPHRQFTVGNIPWTLDEDPSHLATKEEILAHLRHCLETLRARVSLVERYNLAYEGHHEGLQEGPYRVEARFVPTQAGGIPRRIRAKHLVKAFGFRVPKPQPLPLSSQHVLSLTPDDPRLMERDGPHAAKPVHIIGGGKTGMDTAHTLLTRFPGREVHLVIGKGTLFFDRDKLFPSGLERWVGGRMASSAFLELALRFDGHNEEQCFELLRERYGVALNDRCDNFVSAIMSKDENQRIASGVRQVTEDYLVDVRDGAGGPAMVLRGGATKPVAPGSLIVNCTGNLVRTIHPYEPYLSEEGSTVSIQTTSSVIAFQGISAYYLGHLLYLGKLHTLPLYPLDIDRFFARHKKAYTFTYFTQMLYNLLLIMDAVPMRVMSDCHLNFDRWYPPHRQMLAVLGLLANKRRYLAHFRRSLDRACARHQITSGPLACVERAARR